MHDELIIPLIHSMMNLEQLGRYLQINGNQIFVDGNYLKKNRIDFLLNLRKIRFNINSFIFIDDQINLVSNEDIESTLNELGNDQIIYYINYFRITEMASCNICTYSFSKKMKFYYYITNNYPGGLFKYVQKVSLFDDDPFEHEFFIRISESFPMVKNLSLTNSTPQNKNQLHQTNSSIIRFNRLNKIKF